MFEIKKPKQNQVVVIRAATGNELSGYEKRKLATIENNAQENRIEAINLNVNGQKQRIDPINKEVDVMLGSLALNSSVAPADISHDELFIIKCELGDI